MKMGLTELGFIAPFVLGAVLVVLVILLLIREILRTNQK